MAILPSAVVAVVEVKLFSGLTVPVVDCTAVAVVDRLVVVGDAAVGSLVCFFGSTVLDCAL